MPKPKCYHSGLFMTRVTYCYGQSRLQVLCHHSVCTSVKTLQDYRKCGGGVQHWSQQSKHNDIFWKKLFEERFSEGVRSNKHLHRLDTGTDGFYTADGRRSDRKQMWAGRQQRRNEGTYKTRLLKPATGVRTLLMGWMTHQVFGIISPGQFGFFFTQNANDPGLPLTHRFSKCFHWVNRGVWMESLQCWAKLLFSVLKTNDIKH